MPRPAPVLLLLPTDMLAGMTYSSTGLHLQPLHTTPGRASTSSTSYLSSMLGYHHCDSSNAGPQGVSGHDSLRISRIPGPSLGPQAVSELPTVQELSAGHSIRLSKSRALPKTVSDQQESSAGHRIRLSESGALPQAVSELQALSAGLAQGWGWMWRWLEGKPCQQVATQALATVSATVKPVACSKSIRCLSWLMGAVRAHRNQPAHSVVPRVTAEPDSLSNS
jgi:hypothetical protein